MSNNQLANPELNPMNIFEEQEVDVNVKPGEKNVEVSFPLIKGKDATTVEKVKSGCWCTKDPIFLSGRLRLLYDDATKLQNGQTEMSFNRDMTILYNDGKEEQVKDSRGVMVDNPFKAKTILRLKVKVSE